METGNFLKCREPFKSCKLLKIVHGMQHIVVDSVQKCIKLFSLWSNVTTTTKHFLHYRPHFLNSICNCFVERKIKRS
ncbi:hypothetical protein FisN_14Hu386 [Fistulifera solaris]|uniref:Uncharacterized protein n=1 Tax=Fistulifera solaris TaxID=1519565 RepID=A0A1Z5K4M4_FISSO|nr:hypothetical protein FisN_14Hu386 [Fistulifera solaris]|eukprot:GAX21175.1 hypothetical protein FisN_14Hu386 [Fistulifera solaris]